ncbi:MAG TPA: helix-turn-helix domain-containing protein [Pirellulales bacterium]|jgi:excisionase family DNA binding protein|nr:helix-turn-helix domain-containing protein [Pirellulales bacterium]
MIGRQNGIASMTAKTIRLQLAITVDDDDLKAIAAILAPLLKQATQSPISQEDEKREARLRASRHAHFGGQKPPEDQGLLIDIKEAAKLLKVSAGTVYHMHKNGDMPPPIRIGRAVRWSLDALKKWIDAGCPAEPK